MKEIIINYVGTEPQQGSRGAVAVDLRITEDTILYPGKVTLVGTGTSIALPEGTEGLLNVRSSLGARGVMLANDTGIIDSDYRGELKLALYNGNVYSFLMELAMGGSAIQIVHGELDYVSVPGAIKLNAGDRVGQLRVRSIPLVSYNQVTSLDDTERGAGGFGSTGSK